MYKNIVPQCTSVESCRQYLVWNKFKKEKIKEAEIEIRKEQNSIAVIKEKSKPSQYCHDYFNKWNKNGCI